MNSETYSSQYLRSLPVKMRKDFVMQSVSQYTQLILGAARNGQTSYLIQENNTPFSGSSVHSFKRHHQIEQQRLTARSQGRSWEADPITDEEMIGALQLIFPDCKITYQETWVDISPDKKELRKGICVDWSVIKTTNLSV